MAQLFVRLFLIFANKTIYKYFFLKKNLSISGIMPSICRHIKCNTMYINTFSRVELHAVGAFQAEAERQMHDLLQRINTQHKDRKLH